MKRRNYGSSVADGKVLYWSASSLTTGDPDSTGGCARKWHFERIQHLKPPSATWQKLGTEIHAQIEDFLITGRNALGTHALRGMPFLPPPGEDLLVEHDIVFRPGADTATLEVAPLRVRGVPVTGYIDLVHARGLNYGVSDGEQENSKDPDGTVEVIDWKTTSRVDLIKPAEVMAKTLQMTIYGKWVTTCMPEVEHVRLSHVYFLTRGAGESRKVSLRLLPEQIDRHWLRVERVAGLLDDVARESDPNKVEANTRACGAFGGCPHVSYCQRDGLADVFGSVGAARLRSLKDVTNPPVNIAARAARKSLFGKKPPDDPATVKSAAAKIAREEIEAKHPGLPAAWDELVALGKANPKIGQPQIASPLASMIADLEGKPIAKNAGLAGSGELAENIVSSAEELLEFVATLREELARPAAITTTDPVTTTAADIPSILPPDAPPSDPRAAAAEEDPNLDASAPETPDAPPATRGRGRPKGAKNRPKVPADAPIASTAPADTPTPSTTSIAPVEVPTPSTAPGAGLTVYVGCAPSVEHEDLWELVHDLTTELNARAGAVGDFHLVGNDHELAYGRWKGSVATMIRAADLPAGHYALRGPLAGDVAPVVVETLRSIVRERNGVFVQ